MLKRDRRFHRQFDVLSRLIPALRRPLNVLRRDGWRLVRVPLAVICIVGGMLGFMPILGFWMLPLGLLLLAVDLPILRNPISALMIRTRRRIGKWRASRRP